MIPSKFETAIALIDQKNAQDPNTYLVAGLAYPKELLYSQRMSRKLLQFQPNASDQLQIAARAQHICRWQIPRNQYSMDRIGYLKWRETLKKMHAKLTSEILNQVGYDEDFCNNVSFLITKKQIKKNEQTQILEDTICLVFLDYYLEEFAQKHEDLKVVDILKKTWLKMSEAGQNEALKLNYSKKNLLLIKQAID